MPITTNSYQNIEYNGNTVSQIGLSKTLDNYTWDEIFNYQYCGMCNGLARFIMPYKADTNYEDYNDDTKQGFTVTNIDDDTGLCDIECNQTGVYLYPRGLYCKIIWLQGTRSESRTYQVYNSNMANFKLVTEWDAPNFIFTLPDPQSTFGSCATAWTDSEESVKTTWFTDRAYGSLAYRYRHDGTHSDISISGNVMPYMIYQYNGHYYCQQLRQTTYSADGTVDKTGSDAKTGINDKIYPIEDGQPNSLCFFGGNISAEGLYTTTDRTGAHDNPAEIYYKYTSIHNLYCNLDNDDCMGRFRYGGSSPSSYVCLQSFFKSKHASLLFWAGCGVKFYADKLYKPIISDGFVTDFTDDMDADSDLDRWSGDSNHTIPDSPPSPPSPSGDSVDDMTVNPLFGLSSDAGFAAYYLITASQLASLHTWLTTTAFPDGYDPYSYIISLVQFPLKLSPTWCLAGTSGSIHIGGEDTGITASVIGTEQTYHGLGTFDVPRLNSNFLDYDPYTQYEVYIPCCGWVTVPDIVAGHQIVIRINYDLTDASIIGNVYVKINGDSLLIASKSGMMGRQTVVTGEAQGVKSAQITSALLSAGTGALNVATGIISGNAVAAVSGGYNIVAGLAQANIAGNSSYTRSIGSTGGRALLCQYDKCYVKITTTRADIPSNYGHTIGYICNKPGKVSDFSGFSVFDNVDTSGISGATERERQLIKRILETGVIINAAPSP